VDRSRFRRTALGTLVVVAIVVSAQTSPPPPPPAVETLAEFPLDGPYQYDVEFIGITCGKMTLESRQETRDGRPVYHIVFTARNAKFFNKIYRVRSRIDAWVDAETMSSIEYLMVSNEKGETKREHYLVDRDNGLIHAEKNGEQRTIEFDGEPALDPLSFSFGVRALAGSPGSSFHLRMLTDEGTLRTVTHVQKLKKKRTINGRKRLLRVQPMPATGEMFSREGEFVMWIDPEGQRTLYRLDFKLSFGRLIASLEGPTESAGDVPEV
jgi:hypothetical protein